MTWQDCLDLGATRLSRILGCPVTTAHSWIVRQATGKSPAPWEREILILFITAKLEAEKEGSPDAGA